jgi:hypothetical protein
MKTAPILSGLLIDLDLVLPEIILLVGARLLINHLACA